MNECLLLRVKKIDGVGLDRPEELLVESVEAGGTLSHLRPNMR